MLNPNLKLQKESRGYLSGTESRIANRAIPRIAGLESKEILQREAENESNRSKVESRKVNSESGRPRALFESLDWRDGLACLESSIFGKKSICGLNPEIFSLELADPRFTPLSENFFKWPL